ncbi:unnamed protein product [Rotaria socialis]
MLQNSRIISNKTYNIEEYGTVNFDCSIEEHTLVAWRVSLHHDNIYRYYYINSNFQQKLSEQNEDKPRDVSFENDLRTMIFSNVRQWINSAFENIQCVIYNSKKNLFEIAIFYLNIYVAPFLFSLNINDTSTNDQSIFWFDNKQRINILCETYSYPKSILQLSLNHQIIQAEETIDCVYDDLSTILLSNLLCLSQTNWRIRVRINTTLYLSREYNKKNLTCSIIKFPYGNIWKYSTSIELVEKKEKSTELSTLLISSFKFSSRITNQPIINSPLVTSSITQTTTFEKSKRTILGDHYKQISFAFIGLILLSILLAYSIYKNKRTKGCFII